MDTVELSFRYSEQDYVHALRLHYRNRLRLPFDVAAIVILAVLSIFLINSGSQTYGAVILCLTSLFAAMLIAAFFVIPRVSFRRQSKFRDGYILTFSSDGIHFRTEHIDSHLKWPMYTKVLVDQHSYVLYYGATQFSLIPKRVFRDSSERDRFERLLSEKISDIVGMTTAPKEQ